MLYSSSLALRARYLHSICLLVGALGCNGTLQFAESSASSGVSDGASDASDAGDTSEVSSDAGDVSAEASSDGRAEDDANGDVSIERGAPDVLTDATDDRGTGFAPPCYKDTDCPVSKLHCDLPSNQCVECVADRHCVVSPYLRCELGHHRCVECLSASDCVQGASCHPDTKICVVGCRDGSPCPAVQPFCDPRGFCAECRNNADCFSQELCDPTIGRCSACADDRSCSPPTPHCDPFNTGRQRCKECLLPADCTADRPYCDLHDGVCVTKL